MSRLREAATEAVVSLREMVGLLHERVVAAERALARVEIVASVGRCDGADVVERCGGELSVRWCEACGWAAVRCAGHGGQLEADRDLLRHDCE